MSPHSDAFMRALADLDDALDGNIERMKLMKKRIAQTQRKRGAGLSYTEIVESEENPLIVQLLSKNQNVLAEYGARVRRTEARVLHEEGLTMDRIAEKFGVTRQRVSGLLRDARRDPID